MNERGNVAQKSFSADAGAGLFLEAHAKALGSFLVCRCLSCPGLGKEGSSEGRVDIDRIHILWDERKQT